MTIDEAFQMLEVSATTGQRELTESFRRKSLVFHPDTGGNNHLQIQLQEAYELATNHLRIKTSLVPIIKSVMEESRTFETADAYARRVIKKRTRPLHRLKVGFWVTTGVTGFLTFFSKDLSLISLIGSEVTWVLTVIALLMLVVGGLLQWTITRIQNAVDRFLDDISDKKTCAEQLAKAIGFVDKKFCENDLIFPPSIRVFPFGSHELSKELIRKGIEHGLLKRDEQVEFTPDVVELFVIRFKPSLFRPSEKNEQKDEKLDEIASTGMPSRQHLDIDDAEISPGIQFCISVGIILPLWIFQPVGWQFFAYVLAALLILRILLRSKTLLSIYSFEAIGISRMSSVCRTYRSSLVWLRHGSVHSAFIFVITSFIFVFWYFESNSLGLILVVWLLILNAFKRFARPDDEYNNGNYIASLLRL